MSLQQSRYRYIRINVPKCFIKFSLKRTTAANLEEGVSGTSDSSRGYPVFFQFFSKNNRRNQLKRLYARAWIWTRLALTMWEALLTYSWSNPDLHFLMNFLSDCVCNRTGRFLRKRNGTSPSVIVCCGDCIIPGLKSFSIRCRASLIGWKQFCEIRLFPNGFKRLNHVLWILVNITDFRLDSFFFSYYNTSLKETLYR